MLSIYGLLYKYPRKKWCRFVRGEWVEVSRWFFAEKDEAVLRQCEIYWESVRARFMGRWP